MTQRDGTTDEPVWADAGDALGVVVDQARAGQRLCMERAIEDAGGPLALLEEVAPTLASDLRGAVTRALLEPLTLRVLSEYERRARECRRCPETGGACDDAEEPGVERGREIVRAGDEVTTRQCSRWLTYLQRRYLRRSGVPQSRLHERVSAEFPEAVGQWLAAVLGRGDPEHRIVLVGGLGADESERMAAACCTFLLEQSVAQNDRLPRHGLVALLDAMAVRAPLARYFESPDRAQWPLRTAESAYATTVCGLEPGLPDFAADAVDELLEARLARGRPTLVLGGDDVSRLSAIRHLSRQEPGAVARRRRR